MEELTPEEQVRQMLKESLDEAVNNPDVIKPSQLLMDEFLNGLAPAIALLWQLGGLGPFRVGVSDSKMVIGLEFYFNDELHCFEIEQNPLVEGPESLLVTLDGVIAE